MNIRKSRRELVKQSQKLIYRESLLLNKHVCNGLSLNELHRNEQQTFVLTNIVDANDVRMRQFSSNEKFLFKFLTQSRLAGYKGQNDLECDRFVHEKIPSLVNGTHAAIA